MSSSAAVIGANKVVAFQFTLKNAKGEVLDTSEDDALEYLHGAEEIVPGLEAALSGRAVGDAFDVIVQPADGYGDHDPEGVFQVSRTIFPPGQSIEAGDEFVGEDEDGEPLPVRIIGVEGDVITVDANHPLAGEKLFFTVKVRSVREATAEELEHGHVHRPGEEHE